MGTTRKPLTGTVNPAAFKGMSNGENSTPTSTAPRTSRSRTGTTALRPATGAAFPAGSTGMSIAIVRLAGRDEPRNSGRESLPPDLCITPPALLCTSGCRRTRMCNSGRELLPPGLRIRPLFPPSIAPPDPLGAWHNREPCFRHTAHQASRRNRRIPPEP